MPAVAVGRMGGRAGLALTSQHSLGLTNLASTQALAQGFELDYSNINCSCEWLGHVRWQVLQNRNCSTSMTGQQQDIQEESQGGFSFDEVAEARVLESG